MIRLLGFILKIGIVVVLAVWIADRSGTVIIEWGNSVLETTTLMLAMSVFALIVVSYYVARAISYFLAIPARMRIYRHLRLQRKGERLLTSAVEALAEDKKPRARSLLQRAERLLGSSSAVELLRSQTGDAPLMVDQADYSSPFAWKEAIETHLAAQRITEAKRLAETFAAKHPRLASPKKILFDVYVREQNWEMALRMLDILRDEGAMPRSELRLTRAAVLAERARVALQRGQKSEAFEYARQADRLRPNWVPSLLFAARSLALLDKPREAAGLIEKAWNIVPHPQLGSLYLNLRTSKDDTKKAAAAESLAKRAPLHPASQLLVAEALLKAGLFAQARFKVRELMKAHPSRDLYSLLARIEQADHQLPAVQEAQARAAEAPLGEAWICESCRQPHKHWQVLCTACHGFNSLAWHDQPAVIANT